MYKLTETVIYKDPTKFEASVSIARIAPPFPPIASFRKNFELFTNRLPILIDTAPLDTPPLSANSESDRSIDPSSEYITAPSVALFDMKVQK